MMTTIVFPTVENIRENVVSEYQGDAQPWSDKSWHSPFKVTISVPGCKDEYTTDYYSRRGLTNIDGNESANVIQCVLADASCYSCADNIDDFAQDLGYDVSDGIRRIIDAFNGCKIAYTYMEMLGLIKYCNDIMEAIDDDEYEIEEN